jgi:hypothetical protein
MAVVFIADQVDHKFLRGADVVKRVLGFSRPKRDNRRIAANRVEKTVRRGIDPTLEIQRRHERNRSRHDHTGQEFVTVARLEVFHVEMHEISLSQIVMLEI